MIEQIICQLFSVKCNLKSLQLDLGHSLRHETTYRWYSSNCIQYEDRSSCLSLRRLHIQLTEAHLIENLIEHLPNLEEMSVECLSSLTFNVLRESNLQTLTKSKKNWLNKVNEIRFFFLLIKNNRVCLDPKITIFLFKNFHFKRCRFCSFEMAS